MVFDAKKYESLLALMNRGVIRELCPVGDDNGNLAYWHYEVLKPDELPEDFQNEYGELGELRV
jgi:hypothetical protein